MNNEPHMNSTEHNADELDALIAALQAGDAPPQHSNESDVALAQKVVTLVQSSGADPDFVEQLATQLQRPKATPTLPLWPLLGGLVAAMVAFAVVGILLIGDDEPNTNDSTQVAQSEPTDTLLPPSATAIQVAATQPALDRLTEVAQSTQEVMATATPSLTVTPSALPSATLINYQPTQIISTQLPTMTMAALSPTPLPTQPSLIGKATWTAAPATSMAIVPTATAEFGPSTTPTGTPMLDTQTLRGAEIDDNEAFDDYRQYWLDFNGITELDITQRHTIRVHTPDGLPVLGAEITIYADEAVEVAQLTTTTSGTAYFFPRAYEEYAPPFQVVVRKDDAHNTFTLTQDAEDAVWNIELDVPPSTPPVKLDLLFVFDASNGMDDEWNELKDNITNISEQINRLPSRPHVRYGLITYQNRGEVHVVESHDFVNDVTRFQETLDSVRPGQSSTTSSQALASALQMALNNVDWRDEDTVRLIILIGSGELDHSPEANYAPELREAIAYGITIHAIAANGLNDRGEYGFRQIAQFTGGHFVFLRPEPDQYSRPEDRYAVNYLDSLIVRLIAEEMAALETHLP